MRSVGCVVLWIARQQHVWCCVNVHPLFCFQLCVDIVCFCSVLSFCVVHKHRFQDVRSLRKGTRAVSLEVICQYRVLHTVRPSASGQCWQARCRAQGITVSDTLSVHFFIIQPSGDRQESRRRFEWHSACVLKIRNQKRTRALHQACRAHDTIWISHFPMNEHGKYMRWITPFVSSGMMRVSTSPSSSPSIRRPRSRV